MAVELRELNGGKVLHVQVREKLHKEDYELLTPKVERLIQQHGKLRMLFETHDFHGWDAGALWDDIKFDVKHFNDIERLAIVGEKKWEKGMSLFCKPFTTAEVRYFEMAQRDEAISWLEAG